jgi:hypothetical protein
MMMRNGSVIMSCFYHDACAPSPVDGFCEQRIDSVMRDSQHNTQGFEYAECLGRFPCCMIESRCEDRSTALLGGILSH